MRLGILGSSRGTNLQPIIAAIQQKSLSASIEIVISNKADAGILKRAQSFGLQTQFIDPAGLTRAAYDEKISTVLQQYAVDFIVLIGYMRILSTNFIADWRNKIIN